MFTLSRRDILTGGAATLAAVAVGGYAGARAQAADLLLPVTETAHALRPDVVTGGMMTFGDRGPPPVLRLRQGQPYVVDVVNRLREATVVHWHGLRLANAMDGVPYLTQAPIEPGQRFRYTLTSPDAGTFWYHPHCNTLEQMARGLTGLLIVDEAEDPGFDVDLPLNIRDFRLGADGQFVEFYRLRNAARGGTLGTQSTVNWQTEPLHDLPAGGLVRLRLVMTDMTRVGTYDLEGGESRVIALDSHPLADPLPAAGLMLAPGQRADVALRMPDTEGQEVTLTLRTDRGPRLMARFRATGRSLGRALAELAPLPANPVAGPDLSRAETLDFVFGWSPEGDGAASGICGSLGKSFWSINRVAWDGDTPGPMDPLATLRLGRSYILRLRNETPNAHPIHLHGLSFRLLRSNRRALPPLVTDTALLLSQETMEVALVADNPGNWAFHCHVIEHQKTGLTGYLRVA
ncbi:multicopper oxidase family protein [Pannonibacter tanglangensis]|uniref:Multicopper oxidase domain-containing protein n=1 Tax=Pannonibacter tanglangensis TaxID=2750084 RepID=A0ABW9ZES6_9HYPH|nr:multicopper oxidase family protein [Pannonibacter sp. XCT-34]NBN62971.1 multicopper oxidase domain-containing protein [Pannonibacter sp. XCT-34]